MYVVHCAVDCTASIAGGLISFDIDASLIYINTSATPPALGLLSNPQAARAAPNKQQQHYDTATSIFSLPLCASDRIIPAL